ncbi:MAG TPA: hypothetical protein VGF95_10955 [Solirubrobacteraceae bacterium]|jgi:hypothetical protein
MRATRADLLFALPRSVERALVLDGAEAWKEPLRAAGVELVGDGGCDLVVAAASEIDVAARSEAPMLLLEGNVSGGRLRRAGFSGERFLPVPSLDHPSLLLPLNRARGARYALTKLLAPPQRIKRLRNRMLALAIGCGVRPRGTVTLASRAGAPPLLVAATSGFGMPEGLGWVLALGRATERGVFHLFEAGRSLPSWVLKFSRAQLSEVEAPSDARGLAAAAEVADVPGLHVPRLIGVAECGGRPFVVETAAIGAPLVNVLRNPRRHEQNTAQVDAVAGWLVELGSASILAAKAGQSPVDLEPAARLAPEFGVDFASLVAPLEHLPTMLEHGDVGLEHLIVDRGSFVLIDWERAQRHGLPLADLAFFLAQALPVMSGELDDARYGRDRAFVRLFRGESPSSQTLFRWLAAAREAWALDADAIAPLLSVIWLRLAQVDIRRHFAAAWFSEPGLGPGWSASRMP